MVGGHRVYKNFDLSFELEYSNCAMWENETMKLFFQHFMKIKTRERAY